MIKSYGFADAVSRELCSFTMLGWERESSQAAVRRSSCPTHQYPADEEIRNSWRGVDDLLAEELGIGEVNGLMNHQPLAGF